MSKRGKKHRHQYRVAKNHKKRIIELTRDPATGVLVARRGNDYGPAERKQHDYGTYLIDWGVQGGGVVSGHRAQAACENWIDYLALCGLLGTTARNKDFTEYQTALYRRHAAEWLLATWRKGRLNPRIIGLYHEPTSQGQPELTNAERGARRLLRIVYRKLGRAIADMLVNIVVFDQAPDRIAIETLCWALDTVAKWRHLLPPRKPVSQENPAARRGLTPPVIA